MLKDFEFYPLEYFKIVYNSTKYQKNLFFEHLQGDVWVYCKANKLYLTDNDTELEVRKLVDYSDIYAYNEHTKKFELLNNEPVDERFSLNICDCAYERDCCIDLEVKSLADALKLKKEVKKIINDIKKWLYKK